jgi:tetratricopeptide (TPR) repeat protein
MVVVLLAACSTPAPLGAPPAPLGAPPAPTGSWEVLLPDDRAPYAPSFLTFAGDAATLADTARCGECHAAETREWSGSAHAHASFDNPWYRHSVEDLRDRVGRTASNHCAGCHDPVLLVAGRMEGDVDPLEPDARKGVTCLACHGVTSATTDGNASVVIDVRDLSFPAADDAVAVRAHRGRMLAEPLTSGLACGACHRGILGAETGNDVQLVGQDELGAWKASAWAGNEARVLSPEPVAPTGCVGCHLSDHAVAGAQTGVDPARTERLRGAVTLELGEVWAGPGGVERFDLVVWNTATGHSFPGGPGDLQDTWLEVEVLSADGAVLARSGEGDAPGRFGAMVLDGDGVPERTHRTARVHAAALERTVPPGDARATRYALPAPAPATAVRARLLHRKHPAEMAAAACAATVPGTLDGCAPLPVTVVDTLSVSLADPPSYERSFASALALSRQLPERTDEARAPAARALAAAETPRERAAALWVLARVEAGQGRRSEAEATAARAETELGPHPALHRAVADARMQVWAWPEAQAALLAATALAPGDTALWRDLAKASGAAGDPEGALRATTRGLRLQPRDPELLRSQALALTALGHPRAAEAEAAWVARRPADDAADLRFRCDLTVPGCARDRAAIPTVELHEPH